MILFCRFARIGLTNELHGSLSPVTSQTNATTLLIMASPSRNSRGTERETKRMRPTSGQQSTSHPNTATKDKGPSPAASSHSHVPELETEENPFGLKDEAVGWVQEEMRPYGNEGYLLPANCYRPLLLSGGGRKIPASRFQLAAAEYEKRSDRDCDSSPVRPILVAVGVNDRTMQLFVDDEEGPVKTARYLFFPTICFNEHRGALFMTYMPGPIHDTVDAKFHADAEGWRRAQTAVANFLNTGCSSCAHNAVQPDHRIFPFRKYRDRNGNDVDRARKQLPHTRMYWEVEYDHRNIVELRQHGAKLMRRTPYTRLFLGVSISKPDDADSSLYEAAIVLWGKSITDNTIAVVQAVSFGTKDLSAETKEGYSKQRQDSLPGVGTNQWRRPQNADTRPVINISPPPPEWLLHAPFTGLLYKVMTGKRNQDGEREYLLDSLGEGEVSDMAVNLLDMSYSIYMTADAGGDETNEGEADSQNSI